MAVTTYIWHLWPGRHWPALPEEEQQFVLDLQDLADDRSAGLDRMHFTAVVNALRCGITVNELLAVVPGMLPTDLLAAYVQLERLRMQAWHAWEEIVESPTVATITEHGADASTLLPVPLYRIATVASHVATPGALRDAVRAVSGEIGKLARQSEVVEALLARCTPPDARGVSIGTKLHHPKEPALWGNPYFLPSRVTCLSPVRVADLLGERVQ